MKADTFDILLFCNKNASGKVIRAYSKSDFDHVGMCVKFASDPEEIYILEATHSAGVHFVKFSAMIPYLGDYYDKLCVRHLGFEREEK